MIKIIDNQHFRIGALIGLFLLFSSTGIFAQLQESTAKTILVQEGASKGIHPSDLNEVIITDNYTSQGITHVYFRQQVGGIEIQESHAAIHGQGTKFNLVDKGIISGIQNLNIFPTNPISAEQAVAAICTQKSYATPDNVIVKFVESGAPNKNTVLEINNVSAEDVKAKLVYYQLEKGTLNLGWEIEIDDILSEDYINFIVDAGNGNIIREFNYTVYCDAGHAHSRMARTKKLDKHSFSHKSEKTKSANLAPDSSYTVFEWPIEAPHNGDRTDVVRPWLDNTTASPQGWHRIGTNDYTTTRGNNVDAYIDDNNSNGPTGGDAARAQGSTTMEFNFPLDTSMAPGNFKDAAVTNLFYWNNIIHDVWFNYGFDEPSGNFQEENYAGTGGNDSDYVRAEAQDGGGNCNANFSTPTDGGNPRMQMYNCNNNRDGDFDNGVVVHEYGHGISNRLTGGPGNSSCLSNTEQMGEGWSDYFGMVMTIVASDLGTDARGMGTWLFEQGPNGPGIRPYPYSTDFSVNPFTYDNIKSGISQPHGIGSVWATMLWDLTWALIDEYGWDPDIYDGTGGNNKAMALVIEGLKLQPCSPGFVDGRDAILAADVLLNGGANECLIWNVFAKRGLGFSADQGSSNSRTDGTEAFDVPMTCILELEKTVDLTSANPGDNLIYSIKAKNNTLISYSDAVISDQLPANTSFVSASNSGTYDQPTNLVSWPTFTLPAGDSVTYTLEVQIDQNIDGNVPDFSDDIENGNTNWSITNTGASFWDITNTGAASGTFSWFAEDVGAPSIANLVLASPVGVSSNSKLTFTHFYDTELKWDGGVVEISLDGGISWEDQENNFITNGYNNTIYNVRPGFSGNSGGFITSEIDLSSYAGQNIQVRFQMNCDQTVSDVGWWVDDISIDELALFIPNTANIMAGFHDVNAILMTPTIINPDPNALSFTISSTDLSCYESMDGTASVLATNGTGNYTYLWDGGATTSSISNLTIGTYGVTIADGLTTLNTSVTISQPDSLSLDMSSTNAYGGASGTATVDVQGGTNPYSYLWSNGETTTIITNLILGDYYVTVTDNNGCIKTDSVTIIDPTNCSENVLLVAIQLDQFPEQTTLTILDQNNTEVLKKNFASSNSGELVFEYICAIDACYDILITDSGDDGLCNSNSSPNGYYRIIDGATGTILHSGCDFGSAVTHEVCFPFMVAEFIKTNPSCTGLSDGSITVNATGGSGNYTYDFGVGPTGTPTANSLAAGDYNVSVEDGSTTITELVTINPSIATVFLPVDAGNGSLRHAVENGCPSDTITFDVGLMGDSLRLENVLNIMGTRVINGLGMSNLIISGDHITSIFNIPSSSSLSLLNLSLVNAESPAGGGAINNGGMLYLENVLFENNRENGVPLAWSGIGAVIIKQLVEIRK